VPVCRLLVSTGGKYLDACVVQSHHGNKVDKCQIIVPALNHSQVGPVFIEVCYQLRQCGICKLVSLLLESTEILTESSVDSGSVT
jgi:hypothetical protein